MSGVLEETQQDQINRPAATRFRQVEGLCGPVDSIHAYSKVGRGTIGADVAEPERTRGAVRTLDQRGVPGSNDLHRAGFVASCRDRVRGALPRRTQPPGT